MKPLRVVRCYCRTTPEAGGMELHIAELSRYQRLLGCRVAQVFNAGVGTPEDVAVLPGVRVDQWKPASIRDLLFYAAIACSRSQSSLRGADVLHVHGDWSAFLLGGVLSRKLGIPIRAATVHAALQRAPAAYRLALREYEVVFATGLTEARVLSRILGRQVHHCPSGVLEAFFEQTPPSRGFDVMAVMRLVKVKRPELILACASKDRNLTFGIAGAGPLEAPLRREIQSLGLTNVTLLGAVKPLEIAQLLRSSRVALLTSSSEGTPTAVMEAMACGLAVVTTPCAEFDWLLGSGGEGGIVTRTSDPLELSRAIRFLITNEAQRLAMGERNRFAAQALHWRGRAEFVTELFLKARMKGQSN